MMLKKFVAVWFILLAVVISGCSILSNGDKTNMPTKDIAFTKTPEESNTNPPDEASANGWAKAYLDVINDLVDRYGEGAVEVNNNNIFGAEYSCMVGVGIVRLIDFDDDGIYELYCAYQRDGGPYINTQVVYGYDDGLLVLLNECKVSNSGTDVSPSVTFLTKGKIVYLIDVNEIADGNYYTLQNGKMSSIFNYYLSWDDEEKQSTINGVIATREEVEAAVEKMEAGGSVEYISFAYEVDCDEVIKTQETIARIKEQI